MLSKNYEEIKLPLRNYDLQVMIVRYEVAYEEKKRKKKVFFICFTLRLLGFPYLLHKFRHMHINITSQDKHLHLFIKHRLRTKRIIKMFSLGKE